MSRHIRLAQGNRWATSIIASAIIASISLQAAQDTTITGVVINEKGEPVAGALVKLRSEGMGLGFMVVSQAQGRYSSPNLPAGEYVVQGFGGSYQSPLATPIEVSRDQQRKVDLVLNAPLQIPPREKRMTDADYEKLMPAGGMGKTRVAGECVDCHTLGWVVSARKSREKWQETIYRMNEDLLGDRLPLWFALKDAEPLQGGGGTPDRAKTMGTLESAILDYLTKNFGPDAPLDARIAEQLLPYPGGPSHPNRNLPPTLLKGAAAKYVAMEFSLPSGSMPDDIAVDSHGIAWVSEEKTGMLGRFDPNSLTYSRIASPAGKNSKFQLHSITVDPKDQVWYVDDGPNARILQYDPKGREFTSYPIPDYPFPVPDIGGAHIATLRFSNGSVWATRITAQRILKLDPSTRKVTEYAVPRGSSPFGLAVGGDNMIWYAAEVGNAIVKLDPTTSKLSPHDVPTPRSDLRGMAADAQGNLWAAATESGKLVKVDSTGKATEYTPPTEDSGVYSVDVDTKRNLVWFSEVFSDKIGRFDPSANTFVEFPHPIADSDVRRIEIDRTHPNRIWWSSTRADKIGYIEVIDQE